MYDQRIGTRYLNKAIEYYNQDNQWWNNHKRWDVVSVLLAETDDKSSKVVILNEPGQLLNDTRMFQNFGRMVQVRGFAPNECSFKFGPEENVQMLYRDGKTGAVVLKDTGVRNYNEAKR